MVLEFDLNFLHAAKLYPNEYVYLYSKYKGFKIPYSKMKVNIKQLESLGYIKIINDDLGNPKSTVLRQKFIDLVEGDFDRMFAELLSRYPMKVGSMGNFRVLHAADPDAKSNKKAKERYRKIVENKPAMHARIIKALDTQLENQRQNLMYMQLLEVWINNRTWEKWEGFKDEKDDGTRNTKILD